MAYEHDLDNFGIAGKDYSHYLQTGWLQKVGFRELNPKAAAHRGIKKSV